MFTRCATATVSSYPDFRCNYNIWFFKSIYLNSNAGRPARFPRISLCCRKLLIQLVYRICSCGHRYWLHLNSLVVEVISWFDWKNIHQLTHTTGNTTPPTHIHTHTQNSTGCLHWEKKIHPILIKWISLSAFLPSYLSAGSVQTAADNAVQCTLRHRPALTHCGRPFHACPVQGLMSAVSISQYGLAQ